MTTPSTRRIPTDRNWTAGALAAALSKVDPATPLVFGTAQVVNSGTGKCWCGCGTPTKSKFAPGHDARFHGWATKAARGEMPMMTQFVNEEARADYMKWFTREKEAIAKKAIAAPVIQNAPVIDEIDEINEPTAEIDTMSDEEALAAMNELN